MTSDSSTIVPSPAWAENTIEQLDFERLSLTDKPKGGSQSKFLLLPNEIRQHIWRALAASNDGKRQEAWHRKPRVEFLPLMLTCRQLYCEIKSFRPENLVTYNGFKKFFEAFKSDMERKNLTRYRSLTIQFPLNATVQLYRNLATVLFNCQDVTEELRLFFTGEDAYGTPVYVHGCGNITPIYRAEDLPVSGQFRREMVIIQRNLRLLQKLRILVISCMNHQLFHATFEHKPNLQYVHITADPRSQIHHDIDVAKLGVLALMPIKYFPCIKVLTIAANSMLNSFSFPSNCAHTLEHLTWTMPHESFGWNTAGSVLPYNTGQMFTSLSRNAKRLKTLRICAGGSPRNRRTAQSSQLEYAISEGVRRLARLENLEIHFTKNASFFGNQLLYSLPSSLRCFYTTDRLVHPREFQDFVTTRYLSADEAPTWWTTSRGLSAGSSLDKPSRWELEPPWPTSKDCPPDCVGYRIVDGVDDEEMKYCSCAALYLPGFIGEDRYRKDYIPLGNGALKFISYEFGSGDWTYETVKGRESETLTQMVLRLNGRLLDRDRNQHLARFRSGNYIPFRSEKSQSEPKGITHSSTYHQPAEDLMSEQELEAIKQRMDPALVAKPKVSQFSEKWNWYFGNEDGAEAVFSEESSPTTAELPPLTWPSLEDGCEKNHHCHWLCPDASVPTLAAIHSMKAPQSRK